jgi:NTP pyrophosphatase (non-canonical NTP hydrolase)
MSELDALRDKLRLFAAAREWDQFHSPRNLSIALSVEAAELLEHFQWLSEEQSRHLSLAGIEAVGEEIADVLLYLIHLADKLDIDLIDAANRKLVKNEEKYPADKSRGNSKKYSEL